MIVWSPGDADTIDCLEDIAERIGNELPSRYDTGPSSDDWFKGNINW